jgi:signal transduction histidine kinase/PAS domain-containing protein
MVKDSMEEESINIFLNILNGLDAFICVTVPDTGEILYLNDRMKEQFGFKDDVIGKFCYKAIQKMDVRCDYCPYYQLEKNPEKVIVWEQYEPMVNKIFRKTAIYIDWPGGGKGHLEYGIDITDIIQTQKALEYHEKMLNAHKNIAMVFSQDNKAFEDIMTESVGLAVEAVGLDRIAIWRRWVEADGSHATQIYRWDKDSGSTTAPTQEIDDIHYSKFAPDWDNFFSSGECLNGPVSSIATSGDVLKSYGIVSVFISPVFINNNFWGVAIFEDRCKELTYNKEQADLMKSLAHLCVNSIIREDMRLEISDQNHFKSTILSTAPIGFVVFDENLKFLDCNEYMPAMFEVTKEYYLEHFYELSPEYQPNGLKSFEKATEMMRRTINGEAVKEEWVHCTSAGEPIPCEVTTTRIKNKGKFIGFAYVYDLRGIKKLEKNVIEAEERVKLILDTCPFSCELMDRNFKIIDCNEVTVKLFGAKNKQEYMDNFFAFSPEYQPDGQRSHEKAAMFLEKAFSEGNSSFEWTHKLLDETLMPVKVTIGRLAYKNDYIAVVYTVDMREHELMVQKIENALFKAQVANRTKSEFLSRMSHEMLTPMNTIIGMTQLVKLQDEVEKIKDYVGEIDNASHDLLRMIKDLLDISNMEFNIFKLEQSAFSFNDIFNDVLKDINRFINQKQHTFTYDIDSSIPSQLMGDKERLKQVIFNILTNAVKFTPKHGQVSFKAIVLNEDNEKVTLQIEIVDNGIGISKEQQNNLFGIFEQVDGSHIRQHGGIGLGLAFSKRLIEMMDGKIWVESELGKGSKFIFTCSCAK